MENQKKRKTLIANVLSHKMDKSVIVTIEELSHHPLYHKTIKKVVKYIAHDEKNEAKPGDVVKIMQTRPLSKEKRWKIVEIVSRGEVPEVKPEEIA